MAIKLPTWLKRNANGSFEADPDIAYPLILKELGVKEKDVDQYWIEVCRQAVRLATEEIVLGSEIDPRPGSALIVMIDGRGGRKARWADKNFKVGRGARAALDSKWLTAPSEAKLHFAKVKRALIEA